MGLAKLTAGDGYTYLTRQVAAHDSTEKGRGSLEDYYSEKGESPGQWCGAGCAGLGIQPAERVPEAQPSLRQTLLHHQASPLLTASAQLSTTRP